MRIRRLRTSDAAVTVELEEPTPDTMFALCRKAPDMETGGILVGNYYGDGVVAKITEAFLPSVDSFGSCTTFNRGTRGLSEALADRWSKETSHYVGEWHYHPLGEGQPSDTDRKQMIQFAREKTMQSSVPILLIVYHSAGEEYGIKGFLFTREGQTIELQDSGNTCSGESDGRHC